MPAFLLPVLFRLGAAIAVGLLVWGLWRQVDGWCNGACEDATERAEKAEGLYAAAVERATALALLWSQAIEKVETRYVQRAGARANEFGNLRERAGAIRVAPDSCTMRIDAAVSRVMRDATALANDSPAPGVDQGAAAPVPEPAGVVDQAEIASKWLDAAEAYASAREKWEACVGAYQSLESSNEQGQPGL